MKEHPHPLALSFLGFGQALYLDVHLFSPLLAWDYFIGAKEKIEPLLLGILCSSGGFSRREAAETMDVFRAIRCGSADLT